MQEIYIMSRMKELRRKTNMTQTEFANYLHIPVHDIRNWEQEFRMPPAYIFDMIERIMINDHYLPNPKDNFYVFRSNIQHKIKINKKKAILDILNSNEIELYFIQKDYLKCLYLLSCLDTLCLECNYPLCLEYDKYRTLKCKTPVYLSTIHQEREKDIIYLPEFVKHNIYEVSIYDIC